MQIEIQGKVSLFPTSYVGIVDGDNKVVLPLPNESRHDMLGSRINGETIDFTLVKYTEHTGRVALIVNPGGSAYIEFDDGSLLR